jgi:hypothetical protein
LDKPLFADLVAQDKSIRVEPIKQGIHIDGSVWERLGSYPLRPILKATLSVRDQPQTLKGQRVERVGNSQDFVLE